MADVYAVSSAKGGVGKTTTAVNLAAALAAGGHDVVGIDGDIGTPNFGAALGIEPDGATVHDVLAGTATLTDATYEGPHGLRVVPGRDELTAFREADPGRLGSVLSGVTDADYVIVDTSAGLTHGSALPMSVADGTLLVTTPDRDAVAATRKTAALTRELGGSVAGVALNRADETDEVALDAPVLGRIPDSRTVAAASAAAEPLTLYAPTDPAAAAYRRLASRLTVSRVSPPPGVDAAAAGVDETDGTSGANASDAPAAGGADARSAAGETSAPETADSDATDDTRRTRVEPADPAPRDTESAVTTAEGAFGLDPDTNDAPADGPTGADEESTAIAEDAATASDATTETAGGDPEPRVVSSGGDEDLIVAAGSEVEAAEEAKTVLGEPVPESAIERTETERGEAVEYEIDEDAIPFADDEHADDDDEEKGGFFSRLFGS